MFQSEHVYALARSIPPGKVATYGQLAALLGMPNAARAVGAAMRCCKSRSVPCHRVLFHDGSLCREDSLTFLQRQMLASEGVSFLPNGKVDLKAHRWNP